MIPPERENAPSQGFVFYITHVVPSEMMDVGLGQHGVVFQLALAQRRGIAGNDDQLGFARSKGFQG